MNLTDKYDNVNRDHKIFLAQEAAKIRGYTREELRELAGAMTAHGIRLCELLRVIRTYTENPFGKYFYAGSIENGNR